MRASLGQQHVGLGSANIVGVAFDSNAANLGLGSKGRYNGGEDTKAWPKNAIAIGREKHRLKNDDLPITDHDKARTAVASWICAWGSNNVRTRVGRIWNGVMVAIREWATHACRIGARSLCLATTQISVIQHAISVVVAVRTATTIRIGVRSGRARRTEVCVVVDSILITVHGRTAEPHG